MKGKVIMRFVGNRQEPEANPEGTAIGAPKDRVKT